MTPPNKAPKNHINGWINFNKPLGMSSAQAVGKIKWLLKPTKIGHAGTLDPLATGVLPIALGEGTKCVNLLMDAKKTYEFDVTFGESRSTGDAEGEVIATSTHMPTEQEIRTVLPRFTGPISQMPPAYSALKIDGKRAYELARAGEEVVLKARPVTIHSLQLLSLSSPRRRGSSQTFRSYVGDTDWIPACAGMTEHEGVIASFRATVSKGTYIRSLGLDIARAAGSEGYISRLHRAAVGPFTDTDAISLDFLENPDHKAPSRKGILPLSVALDDIPAVSLTAQQEQTLRHGQQVLLATPTHDAALAAALLDGQLVALVRIEANRLITQRMLNRE